MFKMVNRKNGLILVAGGVIGVLLVLILVLVWVINKKDAWLNVYVTPATAKVVIDGAEYRNGSYEMKSGEYMATVSAGGFKEKKVKLEVGAGQSANLFTFLESEADGVGYYEYTANADDYAILGQVARFDSGANEVMNRIRVAEKIYDELPKAFRGVDYYYAIEQAEECEKILCLRVRNFVGNSYALAVSEIEKMGYESARYQILNVNGSGEEM